MRKMMMLLVLAMCCAFFLVACGGGNLGDNNGNGENSTKSKTSLLLTSSPAGVNEMQIVLPVENGNVIGLARGGVPVKIPFANISSIGWNDGCKGWRSNGGKGVFVKLDPNNATTIGNINTGGGGNWSVIEKGGRESFFNLDSLSVNGSQFLITNNTFYYGTATKVVDGVVITNDDFSCPAGDVSDVNQATRHQIFLNTTTATMKIAMVVENDNVINLTRGGVPVKIPFANISSVGWNDGCKGWRASGGNGVFVKLDSNNNTVIKGINAGGGGNWSVLEKGGGRESFFNLDSISASGDQFLITDNTFFYGSAVVKNSSGIFVTNDNFSCISTLIIVPQISVGIFISKTIVNIDTVLQQIEVTPVVTNGRVLNLISSTQSEQVLDVAGQIISGYRIAWNDDGSWYPAGGKISPLVLPKTIFSQATRPTGTGVGMPYLVRPNGTFVPFNTDPSVCIFTVNGVVTKINADGLMPY